MYMDKKRVLSGIRATGRLHLGNYLGMVKGMLKLQDDPDYEVFFMVADLHTLTTPFDPESLQSKVKDVVLDYLAAGLDPAKASVFVQSQVREHVEFAYLLSTEVSIARLMHLPTYKDKVKQFPGSNTIALLYYPVLMAADILLYKAQKLPVGDDQLPHLEITREIARKMNEKYGLDFPKPEQIKTEGHCIPSLTCEGKMSKSVEDSCLYLTDSLNEIKRKLAKVPTDLGKGGSISKEGGVAVLLYLVELFQGKERRKGYEQAYTANGVKYSELKAELATAIFKELEPIQMKRKELEAQPEYIEKVINEGAVKARRIAQETLREVEGRMGLR